MIFRRRDKRSLLRVVSDFFWPRRGWTRAALYVKHRIRRLPDSPDRIARGIWAGIFTSFSPLFGLHFFIAAALAVLMRGNVLAALMSTFFGNPLTFVFIGTVSMRTGYAILGIDRDNRHHAVGHMFTEAAESLWFNFKSLFTADRADWNSLHVFYHDVFLTYLIGGILPGIIVATIAYMSILPLIYAYQRRRRDKIKAQFETIRQRAEYEAVNSPHPPKHVSQSSPPQSRID